MAGDQNWEVIFAVHLHLVNPTPTMWEGEIHQRPYIKEAMHSALNLKCTIRAQLISTTRGRVS